MNAEQIYTSDRTPLGWVCGVCRTTIHQGRETANRCCRCVACHDRPTELYSSAHLEYVCSVCWDNVRNVGEYPLSSPELAILARREANKNIPKRWRVRRMAEQLGGDDRTAFEAACERTYNGVRREYVEHHGDRRFEFFDCDGRDAGTMLIRSDRDSFFREVRDVLDKDLEEAVLGRRKQQ